MATFTVGEVAMMLGVSASTIRNHTEQAELQAYLSDLATRRGSYLGAKERLYLLEDVIVLNTARIHKTQTSTWADVATFLESGERERELPDTAALVMPENRAEVFHLVAQARQQISDLQEQVETLEDKLAQSEQGRRADIERLMKMVGNLEAKLEMHGIDPKTGKKLGE